ncbi:MAG: hypothetical protein U0Q12_09020 [Vicinamibacterales bacterium]
MTTAIRRSVGSAGLATLIAWLAAAGSAAAQTPPTDLTHLSLAELLKVDLGDAPDVRWHVDYRFLSVRFDGYRTNTDEMTSESLLFRPGMTRTARNFPVVPTSIVQQAHLVEVGYEINREWSIGGSVPIVRQTTDHISSVAGFERFRVETGGLGDIGLTVRHRSSQHGTQVTTSAGMSLPTGSIDEHGRTPRGPDVDLPYTMQLGSGTVDLVGGASYGRRLLPRLGAARLVGWGTQVSGLYRVGHNARAYRLGHAVSGEGWLSLEPHRRLHASAALQVSLQGRIDGVDRSLVMPGEFPYTAPVVDPAAYGGSKTHVRFTFDVPLGALPDAEHPARSSFEVMVNRCIGMDLNGPQPAERWRLAAGWKMSF